jgi:hypothetical protein
MVILKSAPRSGKFSTSSSTIVGNGALTCNNSCVPGEDCLTVVGNSSYDNSHTSNSSNKGKRLGGKPSTLVQRTQRTDGSSIGYDPTPFRFSHTMLNVKNVKNNMQLTFIEELFTNHEIKTSIQTSSIQTRYLHFKDMSYKSKSYLCDISRVQLRKASTLFRCGNTQLEVMLSAWKGMPYAKRHH